MVLKLNREKIREAIKENGEREDGRGLKDYRDIEIIPNYVHESAEGSALVKIGGTQVLVGIKMDVDEPYPDRPDQGSLITNTELAPMASPDYESGPPGEEATEIARVIDRGLRESGTIKLTDLCIEEGEKVWLIFVDIHVLDYDGNLMDAAFIGAITALMTSEVPVYDEETELIDRDEVEGDLGIEEVPITATARKIEDKVLFDTTSNEEEVQDSRLTVTFKDDGNLCSMQKGGQEPLNIEEIEDMTEEAFEKCQMIRKKVEEAVEK